MPFSYLSGCWFHVLLGMPRAPQVGILSLIARYEEKKSDQNTSSTQDATFAHNFNWLIVIIWRVNTRGRRSVGGAGMPS